MKLARVRVRPRCQFAPVAELTLLLGLAWGAVSRGAAPFVFPHGITPTAHFVVLVAPCAIFLFWLNSRTQRPLLLYVAGHTLLAAALIVWILVDELLSLNPILLQTAWMTKLSSAIASLASACVAGVIAIGILIFNRTFRFEVIEQTGHLCWSCGYSLMRSTSTACPECAHPIRTSPTRSRLLSAAIAFVFQHSRALAIIILSAVCAAAILRYLLVTQPLERFTARFGDESGLNTVGASMFGTSDSGSQYWHPALGSIQKHFGIYRAIDRSPGHCYIVFFSPMPRSGDPMMQIRIAYAQPTAAGPPGIYEWEPRVICNLDPPAAEHVLQNGVPDTLIEEMLSRAAEDACWPATESEASTSLHPLFVAEHFEPIVVSIQQHLSRP